MHDVTAGRARGARRAFSIATLVVGPGALVMLGENDGPSMLAYATTGATYGIGFFLPFIVVTFVMAYVVQEAVLRIGIATRRGLAEVIAERFGRVAGTVVVAGLLVANVMTLVAEFIAIAAGAAYCGVPRAVAVLVSAALIVAASFGIRYVTWQRAVLALGALNLLFLPAAIAAHPDGGALAGALLRWQPIPRGPETRAFTLIVANIGASVAPWMLFFQQSAVVESALRREDLHRGRLNTIFGGIVAAVVAVAATIAAVPLFTHHVDVAAALDRADFASALRPYLGGLGATSFAVGMIAAGVVAAMTISKSSGYAAATIGLRDLHVRVGSILAAAVVVLIPGAPLLGTSIVVNVVAALLMAPVLVIVAIVCNDRGIMGSLVNSRRANIAGGVIVACTAVGGIAYAVLLIALPQQ